MKVKCIDDRLNHVHFATMGDGTKKAVKIKKGDVFEVKAIPSEWTGLVIPVDGEKAAVVNPDNGGEKAKSTEAAAKKA